MDYKVLVFISIVLLGLMSSCKQELPALVPPVYEPKHLHEAYTIGLEKTGLSNSALGRDWINAASRSIRSPINVNAPYEEEFYVLESKPEALAYKVNGLKGQKIEVLLEQLAGDSTAIFLDAFFIDKDTLRPPELIASLDHISSKLGFEVVTDGEFIIRFQNELLRSGQFKIKILIVPSLDFPVAGRGKSDIGSLFGVERDAGKRRHEGIDIFARRHTPIVAPSDGNINWAGVREGSLGGNVIWMRDTSRNQTLYFAHLEDVFVRKGDKVLRGDTIGSIGNSGNAITTSPHLHFGIYQDGAVDPYHFVVPRRTKPSRLLAKNEHLGAKMRTKRKTNLRIRSLSKNEITTLSKSQFVNVTGIVASYYRVSLPNDDTEGFIFYDDLQPIEKPFKTKSYLSKAVFTSPNTSSITVDNIENQEVKVLATHEDFYYVETKDGLNGWATAIED